MSEDNKFKDRTGEISFNKYGSKMTIIEYINAGNIMVEFENGYRVKSDYCSFSKRKNIKCPYDKTIFGKGYLGEGDFASYKNKHRVKEYDLWRNIMDRCYSEKRHKTTYSRSYKNCSMSDEWLNYQNFAKWCKKNFYEVEDEKMCIDKDILIKGNKIYSSETCIMVPERINLLFLKGNIIKKYPIGVSVVNNRFRARCKINDEEGKFREIHIGYFDTPKEAFQAYKQFKEKYIKQVADEYKDKIPIKLYEAMYKYQIEITD